MFCHMGLRPSGWIMNKLETWKLETWKQQHNNNNNNKTVKHVWEITVKPHQSYWSFCK
jgi:hypothetical protein